MQFAKYDIKAAVEVSEIAKLLKDEYTRKYVVVNFIHFVKKFKELCNDFENFEQCVKSLPNELSDVVNCLRKYFRFFLGDVNNVIDFVQYCVKNTPFEKILANLLNEDRKFVEDFVNWFKSCDFEKTIEKGVNLYIISPRTLPGFIMSCIGNIYRRVSEGRLSELLDYILEALFFADAMIIHDRHDIGKFDRFHHWLGGFLLKFFTLIGLGELIRKIEEKLRKS